jgi:hypothetical protein
MRATKSNDGKYRFDLKITYRLGLMDVVQGAADWVRSQEPEWPEEVEELIKKMCRTTVLNHLRELVKQDGLGWSMRSGDYVREYLDQYPGAAGLEEQAEAKALKLFPELAK